MDKEKSSNSNDVKDGDDGIVIHTYESDMKAMGVKESSDENQKDEESSDENQKDEESSEESSDENQKDEESSEESSDENQKDEESSDKNQEDENSRSKKLSRRDRRIQRLSHENKKLREELENIKKNSTEHGEPNIDDYESYDDYLKAIEESESKKDSVDYDFEKVEAQQELLANGKDAYDDFEELVCAEDLAFTQDILDNVLEMDYPEDVAYYLATHKDETKKIAEMSEKKMLKSLIDIEVKIEKGQKKSTSKPKVTNAPEPIKPVNGSGAKAKTINDNDLSFEEHEAMLHAQTTKTHGGFL